MPIQPVTNPNVFPYYSVADLDIGTTPNTIQFTGSAVSIGNGIFFNRWS